jgi:hypothetical protein
MPDPGFMEIIMTDDQILTEEHVLAIRTAHRAIVDEVNRMAAACATPEERRKLDPFGPPGYYRCRLVELCSAEAIQAWDRFLEDRKDAAKRIDPYTCSWLVTFTDMFDPYGIIGAPCCVGRDFVVWDENSNGEIENCDLNEDQYKTLRERIEREAKAPVLSSCVITPGGGQRMPMPSSKDIS